ncbi:hypothetical protein EYF80_010593 [Liparis tanakae]|uniref:Uncharacterized protein n=1 Tax=Liparis tanakae TaxID=230148 RepID=A0A4Z2IMR8_9TELE|nr:hypothetical protein EYF80_010593 [Liparis tanakae]
MKAFIRLDCRFDVAHLESGITNMCQDKAVNIKKDIHKCQQSKIVMHSCSTNMESHRPSRMTNTGVSVQRLQPDTDGGFRVFNTNPSVVARLKEAARSKQKWIFHKAEKSVEVSSDLVLCSVS